MSKLPIGYIIGAAKAGTTTLADLLQTHPDVGLSNPKEPDFFGGQFHRGTDWYRNCFSKVADKPILIDASTSYAASLWDAPCATVAARIAAARPDAKLVYVLRDPVVRAWSSYWHSVRAGEEHRSFSESLNGGKSVHISAGLYCSRIGEFLRHFDRRALMLVDFRELISRPQLVARQVAEFLGADPARLPAASPQDSHRNASFRWNGVGQALTRSVGLDGVRALARLARATLPVSLYNTIKGSLSRPTPKLSETLARSLVPYFAQDAHQLAGDYGIDVRCGPWWDRADREPASSDARTVLG